MSYMPRGYIPFKEALNEITNSPDISNPTKEMRDWLFEGKLQSYGLTQDGKIITIPEDLWLHSMADEAFKSGELTVCYLEKKGLNFNVDYQYTPPRPIYDQSVFKVRILIKREDLERKVKGSAIHDNGDMGSIYKFIDNSPSLQVTEAILDDLYSKDSLMEIGSDELTNLIAKKIDKPAFKKFKFSKRDREAVYYNLRSLVLENKRTKMASKKE